MFYVSSTQCQYVDNKVRQRLYTHLHPLRDVCVEYEINSPMGFREMTRKRNENRQTDNRISEVTP